MSITTPQRLVKHLNRLVEVVVVMQFALLVIVVTAAVFSRYVLNDSIVWAEELSRYLFVWVSFLGGGLGVGMNIHVGIDSVVELMPRPAKILTQIAMELMIVAFTAVLIWVGAQFTAFGMRSDALLLPIQMGYVYLAVPVGAFIMLVNVLVNLHRHVMALAQGEAR